MSPRFCWPLRSRMGDDPRFNDHINGSPGHHQVLDIVTFDQHQFTPTTNWRDFDHLETAVGRSAKQCSPRRTARLMLKPKKAANADDCKQNE